jgi:hypothetical protein
MPTSNSSAVKMGGFRTVNEFQKWIGTAQKGAAGSTAGGLDAKVLEAIAKHLERMAAVTKQTSDMLVEREKELAKVKAGAKTAREKAIEAREKKRREEEKRDSDNIMRMIQDWKFDKEAFSRKAHRQYQYFRKQTPNGNNKEAYGLILQKMAELTAYASKTDLTPQDFKEIKKLEKQIGDLSQIMGKDLQSKLKAIDEGSTKADYKWLRDWNDYKSDMKDFRNSVNRGFARLGDRMWEGFKNFGFGPVTVRNIGRMLGGTYRGGRAFARGAAYAGGLVGHGAYQLGKGVGRANNSVWSMVGKGLNTLDKGVQYASTDTSEKLYALMSSFTNSTKAYRDRMINRWDKQKDMFSLFFRMRRHQQTAKAQPGGGLFKSLFGGLGKAISGIGAGLAGAFAGLLVGLSPFLGVLSKFSKGALGLVGLGVTLKNAYDEIKKMLAPASTTIDKAMAINNLGLAAVGGALGFMLGGPTGALLGSMLGGYLGKKANKAGSSLGTSFADGLTRDPVDEWNNPVTAAEEAAASQPIRGRVYTGRNSKQGSVAGRSATSGPSFIVKPGANVDKLHPNVKQNLTSMADKYFEMTGKRLRVTSGFRTAEEQRRLAASNPSGHTTASPGNSLHEYGLAVDVDAGQRSELKSLGLLEKYGFNRNAPPKDPVHLSPLGSQNLLKNAKAGNTAAINESFTANKVGGDIDAGIGNEGRRAGGSGNTLGANSQIGVNDISSFSSTDGTLLAMSAGMLVN